MALITIYEDAENMEKFSNMTATDLASEVEEGYTQALTLGTYTGTTQDFNPLDLTEDNIRQTLKTYLITTAQGTTPEDIQELGEHAFALLDTKEIYLRY